MFLMWLLWWHKYITIKIEFSSTVLSIWLWCSTNIELVSCLWNKEYPAIFNKPTICILVSHLWFHAMEQNKKVLGSIVCHAKVYRQWEGIGNKREFIWLYSGNSRQVVKVFLWLTIILANIYNVCTDWY